MVKSTADLTLFLVLIIQVFKLPSFRGQRAWALHGLPIEAMENM